MSDRETRSCSHMSDALLTVKEVMARVRLSRPTIYRWMKTGKFPSPLHLKKAD